MFSISVGRGYVEVFWFDRLFGGAYGAGEFAAPYEARGDDVSLG